MILRLWPGALLEAVTSEAGVSDEQSEYVPLRRFALRTLPRK